MVRPPTPFGAISFVFMRFSVKFSPSNNFLYQSHGLGPLPSEKCYNSLVLKIVTPGGGGG